MGKILSAIAILTFIISALISFQKYIFEKDFLISKNSISAPSLTLLKSTALS